MTVQEAIDELKDWKQAINTLGEYKDKDVSSTLEALDMAIEALTHFNSTSNSIKNELNGELTALK